MVKKVQNVSRHTFLQTLLLHLLPGVFITSFYLLIVGFVRELGFPSLFALFLSIAFVLVPFELGILLYESTKKNNNFSLKNIVLYQERVPVLQFVGLVVILLMWSGVSLLIYAKTDSFFIQNFFSWVPSWFFLTEDLTQYSHGALVATLILGFLLNGIIGPITEELYFRGYLLPRISRFGNFAPLINTLLFSLYHFFTPWQNLGRIVGLMPWGYVVKWKRNIYISMTVHCVGNIISMMGLLSFINN